MTVRRYVLGLFALVALISFAPQIPIAQYQSNGTDSTQLDSSSNSDLSAAKKKKGGKKKKKKKGKNTPSVDAAGIYTGTIFFQSITGIDQDDCTNTGDLEDAEFVVSMTGRKIESTSNKLISSFNGSATNTGFELKAIGRSAFFEKRFTVTFTDLTDTSATVSFEEKIVQGSNSVQCIQTWVGSLVRVK